MPIDEPYGALEARTAIAIQLPSLSVYSAVLEVSIRSVLLMRMEKLIVRQRIQGGGALGQSRMIKVPSEAVQLNRIFVRKLQETQREYGRGILQDSLYGQSERMLVEKLL